MAEPAPAPEHRPSKRAKNAPPDRGPDLQADALFKYSLKLPESFTPASIQANRIALQVDGSNCIAYVANAQNVYEVSLGPELAAAASGSVAVGWSPVEQGKEGVLVPRRAEVGHTRQLDHMSYMAAEVQSLYAGVHDGHHVLAASDSVGNVRLMAAPLAADAEGAAAVAGGGETPAPALQHVLDLHAPFRGECGWTGVAVRELGGSSADGGGGGPSLDVAVGRQRLRDVNVYREGDLLRSLHMMQGPTALSYLPPGPYGGCAEAAVALLAVAEEHQVSLWDVRQGERGGCVQRVGVYGGGAPVYCLSWLATAPRSRQHGGGEGMLAATGSERSVVVLEPRKWHIAAKWPGCVKYPATHLAPSQVAPGYLYVAGLDYEVAVGRWDGSSGSSAGNANSATGGHGRAMGPVQMLRSGAREQPEAAAAAAAGAAGAMAVDDAPEGDPSRGGLTFRGDSKWLGLAAAGLRPVAGTKGAEQCRGWCREVTAALSLSGNLYVLVASPTPVKG